MALDSVSPEQFHAAEGVDDWRVVAGVAWARFKTGSFGVGLALLNDIATLAETQGHHPDLDLAYSHLTVRVWTHAVQGLSTADIALARGVSDLAARRGIRSVPFDITTGQDRP